MTAGASAPLPLRVHTTGTVGKKKQALSFALQIQIGCHTDYLGGSELRRARRVHEHFPVTSEEMEVWNLWGGLIYLIAPPHAKVEEAEVTVQAAVPAPYYKSGGCSMGVRNAHGLHRVKEKTPRLFLLQA